MRLVELAIKSILNEGGNIFKDSEGKSLTRRISKVDIISTIKWLETITKLPLVDNTLGSVGKKESSGDLDIAVDQTAITKEELINRLSQWIKSQGNNPKDWIKKSGISVHFLTPINGDIKQGYVQSDFMFGDDIEHMKFGLFSSGDKSKFSGADRNLLMSSIAKSIPGDYKYSWQKGLISRSTGEVISKNPDKIAQVLLGGKNYNKNDLNSVESIMLIIKQKPEMLKALTDLAEKLSNTEGKKPAEIRADTEEADRINKIVGSI